MTHKNMFTPTPELMQEWLTKWKNKRATVPYDEFFATQAAQWGADQELQACCKWLDRRLFDRDEICSLRAARRPESLKEQALALLDDASDRLNAVHENTIRRALESLPD